MGFKVAWVAVRGKPIDAALADLGLARTGEFEDFPEAEFTLAALPSGWAVVVNNFGSGDFILDMPLDAVKAGAEVLTCYVYENTGMSALFAYQGGMECWTLLHDVEKGLDLLDVVGDPPAPFARLREDALASHAEAQREGMEETDYAFDIAVDLGEALTGYHYAREVEGLGPTPFEVLELAPVVAAGQRVTR